MNKFETAFYTSVGMALKGKEKIEKLAKKFIEDNKMEAEEGKAFVDKIVKQSEAAKKELAKKIDEAVKDAVKKMGYVTKKEADMLRAEIKKLQARKNKTSKKK